MDHELLSPNENILTTKPDKGYGVVILNCTDYMKTVELILNDTNIFQCLGSVKENNSTAKIETKLQKRLLQSKKVTNLYAPNMIA